MLVVIDLTYFGFCVLFCIFFCLLFICFFLYFIFVNIFSVCIFVLYRTLRFSLSFFLFLFFFKKKLCFLSLISSFYYKNHSRLIDDGVSANPLTLSRSAVFRKAGNCSCDTFTSPAYMNSKIACRCEYETSFRMIIGCFDGFSC